MIRPTTNQQYENAQVDITEMLPESGLVNIFRAWKDNLVANLCSLIFHMVALVVLAICVIRPDQSPDITFLELSLGAVISEELETSNFSRIFVERSTLTPLQDGSVSDSGGEPNGRVRLHQLMRVTSKQWSVRDWMRIKCKHWLPRRRMLPMGSRDFRRISYMSCHRPEKRKTTNLLEIFGQAIVMPQMTSYTGSSCTILAGCQGKLAKRRSRISRPWGPRQSHRWSAG